METEASIPIQPLIWCPSATDVRMATWRVGSLWWAHQISGRDDKGGNYKVEDCLSTVWGTAKHVSNISKSTWCFSNRNHMRELESFADRITSSSGSMKPCPFDRWSSQIGTSPVQSRKDIVSADGRCTWILWWIPVASWFDRQKMLAREVLVGFSCL